MSDRLICWSRQWVFAKLPDTYGEWGPWTQGMDVPVEQRAQLEARLSTEPYKQYRLLPPGEHPVAQRCREEGEML